MVIERGLGMDGDNRSIFLSIKTNDIRRELGAEAPPIEHEEEFCAYGSFLYDDVPIPLQEGNNAQTYELQNVGILVTGAIRDPKGYCIDFMLREVEDRSMHTQGRAIVVDVGKNDFLHTHLPFRDYFQSALKPSQYIKLLHHKL